MPRIHTAAPPAPVPPATVAATRRPHASRTSTQAATTHAAATAAPAADSVNASASWPAVCQNHSASIGSEAVATLTRLRPLADLLGAIGQCEADLDRWLANGFALQTYRTPDGHRYADPAEMLAALTEPRPTSGTPRTPGTSRTSGDADESVTS